MGNKEDYYRKNLIFYFFITFIGGVFIKVGYDMPVYNTDSGTVETPYTIPFIIFGAILIVLSFIGFVFYNNVDDIDD